LTVANLNTNQICLVPQEAFHEQASFHNDANVPEKTLNVEQFQRVLQVLLSDKEITSISGTTGVYTSHTSDKVDQIPEGMESLDAIGLASRDQVL
jgi:hypothetical protein